MENFGDQANYVKRLTRVTSFIYDHLDDDLDLRSLADVAALSPFHWHRIYQAVFGESAVATVKRLRLQRAAADLAHTSLPIEDIAARSGYDSVASFNRVFKSSFGKPPAQYRRNGSHTKFAIQPRQGVAGMYDVAIMNVPKIRLVAVRHAGSYLAIGKAFDTLYATLGSRNLIFPGMRSIGLYLDDPTAIAESSLRSKACVAIDRDLTIEAPLEAVEIREGPYAVLDHKGPYSDMRAAYDWLYGEWLVRSGREPADGPIFEEYFNNPRETPPAELRTAIHLPLR